MKTGLTDTGFTQHRFMQYKRTEDIFFFTKASQSMLKVLTFKRQQSFNLGRLPITYKKLRFPSFMQLFVYRIILKTIIKRYCTFIVNLISADVDGHNGAR